jgi:hypothetical protein
MSRGVSTPCLEAPPDVNDLNPGCTDPHAENHPSLVNLTER